MPRVALSDSKCRQSCLPQVAEDVLWVTAFCHYFAMLDDAPGAETHRTSQWKQAPFTSVGILLKDLKDLGFVESGPWLWLIPKKFRDLFRGDDSNLDLSTTSTLAGDVDLASEGIPREICVPEWNGYLESSHMRMPQVPILSNLIYCIYRGLLFIRSPDDGENYNACDAHP